jgi:D-3-phosphoglycerate dehydrogenase
VVSDRPTVVFSERLGAIGDEERRIEAAGAALRSASLWDHDQITANAGDADVVIIGAVEPFDRAALEALPNIRGVVRRGVGYDNVDVTAATELGIPVAIVPDASVEEVSDHALALLVALERRLVPLDSAVHAGAWARDPAGIQQARAGARRLADLTLGIVGFGRIGQALARKALPLYRAVLASDPAVQPDVAERAGVELVDLDRLRTTADHVSVHAPLVNATRNLVNAAFLAALPRGAILVNTSRGGLVDEAAVIAAVRSGQLGGGGLDVTIAEPLPADDALLTTPGIILTAHSASWSTAARAELSRRSTDAAIAILGGSAPAVLANPDVLDSDQCRIRNGPARP